MDRTVSDAALYRSADDCRFFGREGPYILIAYYAYAVKKGNIILT